MRARGRGHVLNVASAAAFGSAPSLGAYNVTKAAVVALSETLAAEASSYGVGVTVLCPGFFRTNILADSVGAVSDAQRRYIGSEMTRSRHDADDVARIAVEAVEAGKLYAFRTRRSAGCGAPSGSRPDCSRGWSARSIGAAASRRSDHTASERLTRQLREA
jgi:short-subunit dehydrogenase